VGGGDAGYLHSVIQIKVFLGVLAVRSLLLTSVDEPPSALQTAG
jgi:hypothetical protein